MRPKQAEPFGRLGYEIKRDVHRKDLDAKIIITSHNSKPGLGKTTLAIQMARDLDRNNWTCEANAFMDAHEYHNAYEDLPEGSALLFDEIEGEADKRRAMSDKNVELSQAWAQNRYRNMITICTLPSVNMLDNRMLEMSDYWINVFSRGVAHPYEILVNDFNGRIIRNRLGPEGKAVIRYQDLPDDDEDYQYLKQMKHQRRTSVGKQYYDEDELEEKVEKAEQDARLETRNEWMTMLYNEIDMTGREIADLEMVDLTQQRVSQIAKE